MTKNSYRIRTKVGEEPNVINVKLNQTFDNLEILSLKISQEDTYKLYKSRYGVVVGRVLANGGVGIPNAKISVFIESDGSENNIEKILYPFNSATDKNQDKIRYNLLPDSVDDACYQNVGTFPNKRYVLDNDDILEVFEKYYKYTTSTNESGDYMFSNIPEGSQVLHVDVDLSNIGFLSQRPRDMVYSGSPLTLFESPTKFKQDTNLDSLAQIKSQNIGVYVYPFWGDTSEDDTVAITRCDIQIDYKFQPTCVFMGSTIADNDGHFSKDCEPTKSAGKMGDLIASQGRIEMIRKRPDGKVEEFPILGNKLINENGVFCYQIPMNLDYITTDEFGNIVPTDDPNKGIPTRASVRFRFTLDDEIGNVSKVKRCSYLVPNNPRINKDYKGFSESLSPDYEFGSLTLEENYRDLFWNKVYTVKSFIPRLQTDDNHRTKNFSGIKSINHGGDKNRFPYNGLTIKLSFQYTLLCFITKFIIYAVSFINNILSIIGLIPCKTYNIKIVGWRPFKFMKSLIPTCIKLGTEFCDDGQNKIVFYPGCNKCVWDENLKKFKKSSEYKSGYTASNEPKHVLDIKGTQNITLMNCVENALIQENESTSYNFYNDWINGTLYFPKWSRYIRPKKSFFFGLFKRRAKDEWCSARNKSEAYYVQHCAVSKNPKPSECNYDCESSIAKMNINSGVVFDKETMFGQTVYYYKPVEYINEISDVMLLFATDIVLLGSLNENDVDGTPQFFKSLPLTTYQLPSDILDVNQHIESYVYNEDGSVEITTESEVEGSGQDWGNKNPELCNKEDGGLFYGVGCSKVHMKVKSCINLRRICELGVTLDETQYLPINTLTKDENDNDYRRLVSDGYISLDEIYDNDSRAMFATMNHNRLKTEYNNQTGYKQYHFTYLYPLNFDGDLQSSMEESQSKCTNATYKHNHKLERESADYVTFRMGEKPLYYDGGKMPRYENSFYFYFGLTPGATAIEKFNTEYFSPCENTEPMPTAPIYNFKGNDWCVDRIDVDENGELQEDEKNRRNGYLKLDLSDFIAPYTIKFTNMDNIELSDLVLNDIELDKVYIGNSTDYLLDNNFITNEEAIERNNNLKDYERLTFDEYDDIVFDSDDVRVEAHKNTYLYHNCTLCNGNWLLTITDGENTTSEVIIPFYTNKIQCNVIADSFRISTENLFNTDVTIYSPSNRLNPPFELNQWDKIASLSDLKYNANTNRKEREIGGLIIVKDIFQDKEKLNKDNVYITVKSVRNILNDKYQLTDFEGNLLDYTKNGDDYYYKPINNFSVPCDKDGYVYKHNENGEKITKSTEINGDIIKRLNNYYYSKSNEKCDAKGYLYDVKVDKINGNKKFIVDSEDIIIEDPGFIYYDNIDTDEDKEKGVFYFAVPVGGEEYEVTVTYRCGDYNNDGKIDMTDNTYTTIVKVNELSPTKLYINNIDYNIIKDFKSGWFIDDTRKNTTELHKNANVNKIVGWNNLTNIAVQAPFTTSNIPTTWSALNNLLTYLTKSKEGKQFCPYNWPEEYVFTKEKFDYLKNLLKKYNLNIAPNELYNFNIDEFNNNNEMLKSDEGYIYVNGAGDIYKLNKNNYVFFVKNGIFSFYKQRKLKTVNEITNTYNVYENLGLTFKDNKILVDSSNIDYPYEKIYKDNETIYQYVLYRNGVKYLCSCDENGEIYDTTIKDIEGNAVKDGEGNYTILSEDTIENYIGKLYCDDTNVYATKNGELFKYEEIGLFYPSFSDVSIFREDASYFWVIPTKNNKFKEVPCDILGYVYDVLPTDDYSVQPEEVNTNTLLNTDFEFTILDKTETIEVYEYVDVLANEDGFVYAQKNQTETFVPNMNAPGCWWFKNDDNYATLYNNCDRITNEDDIDNISYDTYGNYINEEFNGTIYIETFVDYEVANKRIAFKYATEENGKVRYFKKCPKNNIFTKDENGIETGLIYMYNPTVRNSVNNSLPKSDNQGYLCDKDGYVYKTNIERKCRVENANQLAVKIDKKVFDNNEYLHYENYHYFVIDEVDGVYYKYYLETDSVSNNTVLVVDENITSIRCDKEGYLFKIKHDGTLSSLSNVEWDIDKNIFYTVSDNNIINLCGKNNIGDGYTHYSLFNGDKYRLCDEYGNVLPHDGFMYKTIQYTTKTFKFNNSNKDNIGIVRKQPNGQDLRIEISDYASYTKGVLYYETINTPCDSEGYVYVSEPNNKKVKYCTSTRFGDNFIIKQDIHQEYVFVNNDDEVYVKLGGKPVKLTDETVVNKLGLKTDDGGYVFATDDNNENLKYNYSQGILTLPCDNSGYIYDVKNCNKYILPYQIEEDEKNVHTTEDGKKCDINGWVYELDGEGNKIKTENQIFDVFLNSDEDGMDYGILKYISLGGPIKLRIKKTYEDEYTFNYYVDDGYFKDEETGEEKSQLYKLDGLKFTTVQGSTQLRYGKFYLIILEEDFSVIDNSNAIEKDLLNYGYYIYCNDDGKIQGNLPWGSRLYEPTNGNFDTIEFNYNTQQYELRNVRIYYGNNKTDYVTVGELNIKGDEWGYVSEQDIIIYQNDNTNIAYYNQSLYKIPYKFYFYDIPYVGKVYVNKDGYVNSFDYENDTYGYIVYENLDHTNDECYQYISKESNGDLFVDLNPLKIFCNEEGFVSDEQGFCTDLSYPLYNFIYNEDTKKIEKEYLVATDKIINGKSYYYYQINNVIVHCDKDRDGWYSVSAKDFEGKSYKLDVLYDVVENEVDIVLINNKIIDLENLPTEFTEYKDTLKTKRYFIDNKPCDKYGYLFLTDERGNVITGTIESSENDNEYFYTNEYNHKIICDKDGYVYKLNSDSQKYQIKTTNTNFQLNIKVDDNGYLYEGGVLDLQYKLLKPYFFDNDYVIISETCEVFKHKYKVYNNYLNYFTDYECICIGDGSIVEQDDNGNILFKELTYDFDANGQKYKLYFKDPKKGETVYQYNNATITHNSLNVETYQIDNNKNILLKDDEMDYLYDNTFDTLYPCDKYGNLYVYNDNKLQKPESDASNGINYTFYYNFNNEEIGNYDFDANGKQYQLFKELIKENGDECNIVIPCDSEGFIYDTFNFDGVYEKYGFCNNTKVKDKTKFNGKTNNVYYYLNIPCDKDGYVYKLDKNGEKYKTHTHLIQKNGEEYNIVIPCDSNGYVYLFYGKVIDYKTIPCDDNGYIYDFDENLNIKKCENSETISYDIKNECYYFIENNNGIDIKVICDRDGWVYKLYNNQKYKLIEKEVNHQEYNLESGYIYLNGENNTLIKKYKPIDDNPNVYECIIETDKTLCNRDGFIINTTKIDGETHPTLCDVDGYVFYTFDGELSTEETFYKFYNDICSEFVQILDDANIYINRRIELVKSMQELFWVNSLEEPKRLYLTSKTDFIPVEYKIGYIKEEFVNTEDDIVVQLFDNGDKYNISSTTYTFSNQNKLDVYIPTLCHDKKEWKYIYQCDTPYWSDGIIYNSSNSTPLKYKGPYIIGMKNSIDNTIPYIKSNYFKIEYPLVIGRELFHLHFLYKPFTVNFTVLSTLVDYPVIPVDSVTYNLFCKSNGYINMDGILYDCTITNGSIYYDDFNKINFKFKQQTLNNSNINIKYNGQTNEDKFVNRKVVGYEDELSVEGIMSQQSNEIKNTTLTNFVCSPYVKDNLNPCLLPPYQTQLTITDNFTTLDETVYCEMTVKLIKEVSGANTYYRYRVDNGDGNEVVRKINYNYNNLFGDGILYDEKYHLIKLNKVIDIKKIFNEGEAPTWDSENGFYYFENISSTPQVLIAKTQNNCYGISKPFMNMEPAIYEFNAKINIIRYGHNIVSNLEKIRIYYTPNMCAKYNVDLNKIYVLDKKITDYVDKYNTTTFKELQEAFEMFTYEYKTLPFEISSEDINVPFCINGAKFDGTGISNVQIIEDYIYNGKEIQIQKFDENSDTIYISININFNNEKITLSKCKK